MNEEEAWQDNRPCDRLDPRFLRLAYLLIFLMLGLGGLGSYLLFAVVLRWQLVGTVVGVLDIMCAGIFAAIVTLVDRGMAVEVRFGSERIAWKTRKGSLLEETYDDVLVIKPSRWKGDWLDGRCHRFFVDFPGAFWGTRRFIGLTPGNKERLMAAMKAIGARSMIYED